MINIKKHMQNCEFGKYTYYDKKDPWIIRCWGTQDAKLKVGNFCSIAANVQFNLDGNHCMKSLTTYPFGHIHKDIFNITNPNHPCTKGPITVGNAVWICENTKIMSGVTIGDGAVIANNSHVIKDVKPFSLHGGNPAKFIKYLFPQDIIEKMLVIKWWNWDDEKIKANLHYLCSTEDSDIQEFLNKHYEEALNERDVQEERMSSTDF